jgi:uncharacterized lipoprotein YddW (UPF0748 family)
MTQARDTRPASGSVPASREATEPDNDAAGAAAQPAVGAPAWGVSAAAPCGGRTLRAPAPPSPTYPPAIGLPGHPPPAPAPTPAPRPGEAPAPETRALWISRFDLGSPPVKRASLEALINKAAGAGFNTVLLQVRATGDAYYTPGVEPWSYRMTSSRVADLGRNPGWDPLAAAIDAAHQRGIQLHAYLNAFTLWECDRGGPPHTTPEHAYWKLANYDADTKHYEPTWRVYAKVNGTPMPMGDTKTGPVACSEYLWASAGVDRVHEHNLAVIRDIATRYAVDGIHLDRVRYPGRQYSHDPETYAAWHAASPPVSLEDWQRDHLSQWMARYKAAIKEARPKATFSAAVWFTYRKTAAMNFITSQGYADYYQDSHRWLKDGCVDAIAPMIYGATFDTDIAKWKVLADDHVKAQGTGQVWLGIGAAQPAFTAVAERIDYAQKIGALGVSIWSAGEVDRRGYWDDLTRLWAAAGPFK